MAVHSILNDVLGPVMRGPSSSHTAGAWRLGALARMLVAEPLASVRVSFDPAGSYAPTWRALGVEAAFAAAFLGLEMTDEAYPRAPALARDAGLDLRFVVEPLTELDHPNAVRLALTTRTGARHVVWGSSVGGGMVEVCRFDACPCRLDGQAWVVLAPASADLARLAADLDAEPELVQDGWAQWSLTAPPRAEAVRGLHCAEPLMAVPRGAPLWSSASEMVALAASREWTLGQAALAYETALLGADEEAVGADVVARLALMRAAVERGLDDSQVSLPLLPPGAGRLWRAEAAGRLAHGGMLARAVARGLAVLHVSNAQGVICAAPTGGSAGVLPGVLVTLADERGHGSPALVRAFLAAGAVGLVMAQRATFAAEEAGCQVEIGVAGAMAAAAVVELAGGTARQAASGASMALQNTLGMVCDPVDGGCEIPCHTRTAAAIAQAFVCADLALADYPNPIALDDAVAASYAVGRQLPAALRCTAQGGIAVTKSALALVARRRA